jgi:hypothetical protein
MKEGEATGRAGKLRISLAAFGAKMLAMGDPVSAGGRFHQRSRAAGREDLPGSPFVGFKNERALSGVPTALRTGSRIFLGAMYISYGLALVIITVLATGFWLITKWWITDDVIWAVVLFLPLAPAITYFSRVLWIYFDQTVDPDRS